MARCRCQLRRVIEGEIVIHQKRLAGFHDELAVLHPDAAGRVGALFGALYPGLVFAPAENIFGVGEGGHPALIHRPGVSAAMIDMKIGAKDVINIGECQPVGGEPIGPGPPGEIMRRPVAFVLAEAGVDQDGVVRCPYNVVW